MEFNTSMCQAAHDTGTYTFVGFDIIRHSFEPNPVGQVLNYISLALSLVLHHFVLLVGCWRFAAATSCDRFHC
jgi:hypothetical protein